MKEILLAGDTNRLVAELTFASRKEETFSAQGFCFFCFLVFFVVSCFAFLKAGSLGVSLFLLSSSSWFVFVVQTVVWGVVTSVVSWSILLLFCCFSASALALQLAHLLQVRINDLAAPPEKVDILAYLEHRRGVGWSSKGHVVE